jgi:hypothetical protein
MNDRLSEYLARAAEIIEQEGWLIQGVFPVEEDGDFFSYTVGLTTKGLPELIVFGWPPEVAGVVLNDIARAAVAGTIKLAHGEVLTDFLDHGYKLTLCAVKDTREHLTVANRFYGIDGPVRAVQLVWPDAEHRFPWEGAVLETQPIISHELKCLGGHFGDCEVSGLFG